MTHRFPIKEVARQAGLGTATVDRVINDRAHVSPQTRARVHAALRELEAQEHQLSARGRRMFVDVVVEAPQRFSRQVQAACEAVLPQLSEAVFRPRFLLQELMQDADMAAALKRIRKRGSAGVILKARDVPQVRQMVDMLEAAGIPVVTLVTDIPTSRRSAYAGVDNAKAGQVAAYLLAHMLPVSAGTVLTTRSQDAFQGEAARYAHFKQAFLKLRPGYRLVEFTGGAGLAGGTRRQLGEMLRGVTDIDAVYSMGGGNRAILDVLRAERRAPKHYIAHDLDAENRGLLRDGQISFVLHHDLRLDMQHAFRALASRHGFASPVEKALLSDVQILTPYNLPGER